MITFTIPGEVRGKGRPRAANRGGRTVMYTDARTVAYEAEVALRGRQAMAGQPPLEGPVTLLIEILVKPPVSWPHKRRTDAVLGLIYPTGRPDIDNVSKAIMDGLNGVAWLDDSQVVVLVAAKCYSAERHGCKVTITPTPLGMPDDIDYMADCD